MLALALIAALSLGQTQTQIVDGTVATRKAGVNASNELKVSASAATVTTATASGSCVSVTTSSTTLAAANTARKAIYFVSLGNNSARVRFKLGTTATTSNMPLEIGQSFGLDGSAVYTGQIDAISESGTQTVCVVEL